VRRSSKSRSQAAPSSAQWEDKTQKQKQERFPLNVGKSFSSARPGLSSLLPTSKLVLLAGGAQTRELLSSLPAHIVL